MAWYQRTMLLLRMCSMTSASFYNMLVAPIGTVNSKLMEIHHALCMKTMLLKINLENKIAERYGEGTLQKRKKR